MKRKKKIKPWNRKHAEFASEAIETFQNETGGLLEDTVCDLLCDLMHWCDVNDFDFIGELDRAETHYRYEKKRRE